MKRISQTGDRRNLVTLAELRHKRVRLTIPFTAPVIAGAGRVLADGSAVVLPPRDGSDRHLLRQARLVCHEMALPPRGGSRAPQHRCRISNPAALSRGGAATFHGGFS